MPPGVPFAVTAVDAAFQGLVSKRVKLAPVLQSIGDGWHSCCRGGLHAVRAHQHNSVLQIAGTLCGSPGTLLAGSSPAHQLPTRRLTKQHKQAPGQPPCMHALLHPPASI